MYGISEVLKSSSLAAESQSKTANIRCEQRLERCERELAKMSAMLKSQDSLCSALVTEIKIYKALGKI